MAPDPVDRLYDLPLAEFTPARDALAKELRAAGDRDAAATVKALRKPSAAAWAINRAVRADRDALRALLDAGDWLRDAQARLLSGDGDRDELRRATEAERRAVSKMVGAARAAAGGTLSAAVEGRVRETLHAAVTDDALRAAVTEGRLEREAEAAAFTASGPAGAGPVAKAARKPGRKAPERSAAAERLRQERRTAEAALAAATAAVEAAEERARAQAEALDAARASLAAAERQCRDAQRDLREAKAAAAAAQSALDAAEQRSEPTSPR